MATEHVTRYTLMSEVGNGWEIIEGGQSSKRQKDMKALTNELPV